MGMKPLTHSIKVMGRDLGPGDCITANIDGEMTLGYIIKLGEPVNLFGAPYQFRECEFKRHEGPVITFNLNDDKPYMLVCFQPSEVGSMEDDELDLTFRTGYLQRFKFESQKFARLAEQDLVGPNRAKYKARDGRYIFHDGSALRVLPDCTRILYGKSGEAIGWPKRGGSPTVASGAT